MTAGVIHSPELPAVSVTSELNDTWFPTATFVIRQLDCLGGFGMRSPSNVINASVHSRFVQIIVPWLFGENKLLHFMLALNPDSSLICLDL